MAHSAILLVLLCDFMMLCSASRPTVLALKVSKQKNVFVENVIPVVLYMNHPFTIQVLRESYVEEPQSIECYYDNTHMLFKIKLTKNTNEYYVSKTEVIASATMNVRWNCRLYCKSRSPSKFDIRVNVTNESPPYIVEMKMLDSEVVQVSSNPSLLVDQWFTIEIYSPKYKLISLECYGNNWEDHFFYNKITYHDPYLYGLQDKIKATSNMDTEWICALTYYGKDNQKTNEFTFKVSVTKEDAFLTPAPRLHLSASPVFIIELETSSDYTKVTLAQSEPSLVVGQLFTVHIYSKIHALTALLCQNMNHYLFSNDMALIPNELNSYAFQNNIAATSNMNGIWNCTLDYSSGHKPFSVVFYIPVKVTEKEPKENGAKDGEKYGTKNNNYAEPKERGVKYGDEHATNNDAATTSDLIEIHVYKGENKKQSVDVSAVPHLTVNQYFNIKITNLEDSDIYTHIKCHPDDNETIFIDTYLIKDGTEYTTRQIKATSQMEALWNCHIEVLKEKPIDFEFRAQLKKTDADIPTFSVNGATISRAITGLEVDATFNAIAEYSYYKEELAKITCERRKGKLLSMNYTFYNGTQVFNTTALEHLKQTIYVKLMEQHEGSYLDCAAVGFLGSTLSTIRLVLKQRTNYFDEQIFQVNGLKLAPTVKYDYFYDYYYGEPLTILGRLHDPTHKWNCIVGTNSASLQSVLNQHENDNLTVTLDYDKSMSLPSSIDCQTDQGAARLTLHPLEQSDPMIHGLALSETLLSYQKNMHEFVIQYKNTKRHLNLTCTSKICEKEKLCKWDFNSTEINAGRYKFTKSAEHIGVLSNGMFQPMGNGKTTIKCICNSTSVSAEIFNELSEQEYDIHSSDKVIKPPEQREESAKGPGISLPILIAIVAGTVAVVVVVVCIIVSVHKRKQKREQAQSAINYENLPEHNEGPMPTPAQWNNYTSAPTDGDYTYCVPYVEKNIEEMYAKPQPKNQRQPAETLYAEIENQGEPTYTTVGQEVLKNVYANSKEVQAPTYSQIQPKKLKENPRCAPQVLPKPVNDDNYAQVLPKGVRMQAEASKYANVFPDPRYVNALANGDYAEPYCEVSVLNCKPK